MTLQTILALSLATSLSVTFAAKAHADEQAAIDGCIDQLRTVGGPDAQAGGEILSSSWSEAGTLVQLRDAGGTTWECIGYDDGTVGDLRVVDAADDGGGAMAGASTAQSGPVVVHFQTGTTGATYDGDLGPGEALQYILGARNGQVLTVRISPPNGDIYYQIINPDDSRLLDMVPAGTPYEGQLWQSGDHVVEMVNQTDETVAYRIELAIKQNRGIRETQDITLKGSAMFDHKVAATLVGITALAGCMEDNGSTTSTPAVGSSSDLSSFQGARAGQAEMGIQSLGYEAVRTEGLTTWWFNRSTGACARIVTSDGRYSQVDMLPAQDC